MSGVSDVSKVLVAIAALIASLGGFWVAISGDSSDSSQVPAVIIVRGATLPEDDGLSDSERDREYQYDG